MGLPTKVEIRSVRHWVSKDGSKNETVVSYYLEYAESTKIGSLDVINCKDELDGYQTAMNFLQGREEDDDTLSVWKEQNYEDN